jgi:AhpC/TSA family
MAGVRREGSFPDLALPDLKGKNHPMSEAWSNGDALFLVGHRDCKTTRETIPYFDRIHRRSGGGHAVRLVLQDDTDTARTLVSTMGLAVPVRLEADPYPLAQSLNVVTVPTLFLVDRAGKIAHVTEAFNRAELEMLAARMGVAGPLFAADDKAPAFKPG